MIDEDASVLVDTNVIIEAHRTGCWNALVGRYHIETVEKCVEECDTGNQRLSNAVDIDTTELRKSVQVKTVSDKQMARFVLRYPSAVDLDAGEKELLAHAMTFIGPYLLCSPDKACIRMSHEMGLLDKNISLEELVEGAGKKVEFKDNYQKKWLERVRTDLLLK